MVQASPTWELQWCVNNANADASINHQALSPQPPQNVCQQGAPLAEWMKQVAFASGHCKNKQTDEMHAALVPCEPGQEAAFCHANPAASDIDTDNGCHCGQALPVSLPWQWSSKLIHFWRERCRWMPTSKGAACEKAAERCATCAFCCVSGLFVKSLSMLARISILNLNLI